MSDKRFFKAPGFGAAFDARLFLLTGSNKAYNAGVGAHFFGSAGGDLVS